MRIRVSLPDEIVEYLDEVVRAQGYASRSAVVHNAVRLLRAADLGADYECAWDEWATGGDADVWKQVAADGLAT